MFCRSSCRLTHVCVALGVFIAALSVTDAVAAIATFIGLGDLPGGAFESYASDVSANGSVVVGQSSDRAFRWTQATGLVELSEADVSQANAITADGKIIVGRVYRWLFERSLAVMWNQQSPAVEVYLPSGQREFDEAVDVSADGSVVVGNDVGPLGTAAIRWTAAGREDLGILAGHSAPQLEYSSYARAVTADGSVVVGASFVKFDVNYEPVVHAFRWTEHMGMVDLETASGVTVSSYASDITPNGNVIVGKRGEEVFRWTEESGMVGLGNLSGRSIWPSAVSADGNIIVGQSTRGDPFAFVHDAFIWTPRGGMENLQEKLLANGATGLDGWELTEATAISADGRTIVGNGINPFGQNEAWIATLPIPESSTLVLLSVAAAGICARRFR